jgi:L-asparaginase II
MVSMANPVIAEVTRGTRIESVHRGAWAVVDDGGRVVASAGDVETPVFARSALKLLQALPLVESGAAAAAGFGRRELALACASHSGEAEHVATAARMLEAAGLDEEALGCGAHWPRRIPDIVAVANGRGEPSRLHNNCSGKHAGFLVAAHHRGECVTTYLDPAHPLQAEVRGIVETVAGVALAGDVCSIDGCSAPTFAVPVRAFAASFARLGTGSGLPPERAAAARTLMTAAIAEPWYTAGTERACTALIEAGGGSLYAKTGAEGFYVAALPDAGLAIAAKCDDGAARAVEVVLAALLLRHLPAAADRLAPLARIAVRDWNGQVVGEVRPVL